MNFSVLVDMLANCYCLISKPDSFKALNDLKYLATKPKF